MRNPPCAPYPRGDDKVNRNLVELKHNLLDLGARREKRGTGINRYAYSLY